MADVLRDLRVRVGVDASGVQQGMARIRAEVNSTSQQLDQFSRAAIQPTLSPDITSQISKWDVADRGRLDAIRGRVGSLNALMLKAQSAQDAAIAGGNVKQISAAERNISAIQRTLNAQQLAARHLADVNLAPVAASLSTQAEKAGVSAGERMLDGFKHAGLLGGSRLAGLPISGRAVTSGLPFIAGLVVTDAVLKGLENAAARAEKLRAGLDALRSSTGLSIDDTAKLGAEAQAAGVDFGALAKGVDALSGTGLTFTQAQAQVQGFGDKSLQAAEAQRLFGAAAKDIAPLLLGEGAAAKVSADQIEHLREVQISSAVAGQLDKLAPKGNLFDALAQGGADFGQLIGLTNAATTAEERAALASGDFANASIIHKKALDALLLSLHDAIQGDRDAASAMKEATDRTNELAKSSTSGSTALQAIATSAEAVGRAMSGADIATDALGKKIQNIGGIDPAVASAFDKLTTAGVVGPTTKRDLEIVLAIDPASQAAVLRDIEGLGSLAGQSISQTVSQRLGAELVGDAQSRLDRLIGVKQQEEDIAQRIADIQFAMDERHKKAIEDTAFFNRSDLDRQIQAREDEKSFFAFKDTKKKTDTSHQDAADTREIARLQAQLGRLQKDNPDIDAKIAQAQGAVADLQKIVDAWLASLNKIVVPKTVTVEPHDVPPGPLGAQGGSQQTVDTPPNSRDLGINAAQAAAIAEGASEFTAALSTGSLRLAETIDTSIPEVSKSITTGSTNLADAFAAAVDAIAHLVLTPRVPPLPSPLPTADDHGAPTRTTTNEGTGGLVLDPDLHHLFQQLPESADQASAAITKSGDDFSTAVFAGSARLTEAFENSQTIDVGIKVDQAVTQTIDRIVTPIPDVPSPVQQLIERDATDIAEIAPTVAQLVERTATSVPELPDTVTQKVDRVVAPLPDVAPSLTQEILRTVTDIPDVPPSLNQEITRTVSPIPDIAPTLNQEILRTATAIPDVPSRLEQTIVRVFSPLPEVPTQTVDTPPNSQDLGINASQAEAITSAAASFTDALSKGTLSLADALSTPQTLNVHVSADAPFSEGFEDAVAAAIAKAATDARIIVRSGGGNRLL